MYASRKSVNYVTFQEVNQSNFTLVPCLLTKKSISHNFSFNFKLHYFFLYKYRKILSNPSNQQDPTLKLILLKMFGKKIFSIILFSFFNQIFAQYDPRCFIAPQGDGDHYWFFNSMTDDCYLAYSDIPSFWTRSECVHECTRYNNEQRKLIANMS